MFKTAVLFLNGELPAKYPTIENEMVICTDGAYNYLKKVSLKIDYIIGDLDSLEDVSSENIHAKEIIHIEDQNTTDFEKALQFLVDRKIEKIKIYGATGLEHDHFLGNLSATLQYKDSIDIIFYDDFSTFYFTKNKEVISTQINKTISLYPFPTAKKITTKGLQYPLQEEDLDIHTRVGTRNKAIDTTVEITYKSGNLLLFVER